jgi:hypothetical protein
METAALRCAPHLHKRFCVRLNQEPGLRTVLAMLCVALSVVFAGASAASVIDGVQHAAHLPHQHGLHLAFSVSDTDHHADHHDDGDHHDDDGAPGDHQPGAGHHHADAPVGTLSADVETGAAVVLAELTLRTEGVASAKGVRPGGLERPPKLPANLT